MERAFSRDSLYSDNEFQNYPVKACRQELTKKLTSEMKEAGVSWDDPPMEESLADYVQDLVVQCMKKGEGGLISGYGEGTDFKGFNTGLGVNPLCGIQG
jgi:hypothetical protein